MSGSIARRLGPADRWFIVAVRRWIDVVTGPRRFFGSAVVPGEQAPALGFAGTVVVVAAVIAIVVSPTGFPVFRGRPLLSALLVVGLLVVLVVPVGVHLVAAVETLGLLVLAPERGGISETVQVICYSMAPCVVVGLSVPTLTAVATWYGFALLVTGTAVVHRLPRGRALVTSIVPGTLVFGYGFGGLAATAAVLRSWYII